METLGEAQESLVQEPEGRVFSSCGIGHRIPPPAGVAPGTAGGLGVVADAACRSTGGPALFAPQYDC